MTKKLDVKNLISSGFSVVEHFEVVVGTATAKVHKREQVKAFTKDGELFIRKGGGYLRLKVDVKPLMLTLSGRALYLPVTKQ